MRQPEPRTPRSGDVVLLGRAASVQFVRPIRVRVIRQLDWPTYDGWCWIDAYQLNDAGDATERRSLFVLAAGVEYLTPRRTAAVRPGAPRRTTNQPPTDVVPRPWRPARTTNQPR